MLSTFRKKRERGPVHSIYSAIVAQSRHPHFYRDWGVPDTVTGRFDMISLHLVILFRRLRTGTEEARAFSQEVLDLFFSDMDRSLRVLGVGDLSVGRKVRRMSEVFFGLLTSLDRAAAESDPGALEAVLARNIYAGVEGGSPAALASYFRETDQQMAKQPLPVIIAGSLQFNDFPGDSL